MCIFRFEHGLDPSAPPPPHCLTLILGEPGSGKTSLMRLILLQRLLQGRTLSPWTRRGRTTVSVRPWVDEWYRRVSRTISNLPDSSFTSGEPGRDVAGSAVFDHRLEWGCSPISWLMAALHAAVKRRWERRPGPMSLADLVDALGTINELGQLHRWRCSNLTPRVGCGTASSIVPRHCSRRMRWKRLLHLVPADG